MKSSMRIKGRKQREFIQICGVDIFPYQFRVKRTRVEVRKSCWGREAQGRHNSETFL